MDPVALSDEQRLDALRSVMSAANQLTAATARISLAVDRSTQWAADGARSSSSWISRRTNSDASTARQDIHIASLLRDDLPAFDRAVTAGTVSWAHVRVVSAFIGSKPERREAVVQAEDILLALAKRVEPSRMWPALRRIAAAVDRDVTNGECPADKRFFVLSRTLDGYHLTGWVDLVDGSLLRQTLRAIVDSSHRRGIEGPHAIPGEVADDEVASDERTNATRTLDALMFMAEKYASASFPPPGASDPTSPSASAPMSWVSSPMRTFMARAGVANQSAVVLRSGSRATQRFPACCSTPRTYRSPSDVRLEQSCQPCDSSCASVTTGVGSPTATRPQIGAMGTTSSIGCITARPARRTARSSANITTDVCTKVGSRCEATPIVHWKLEDPTEVSLARRTRADT